MLASCGGSKGDTHTGHRYGGPSGGFIQDSSTFLMVTTVWSDDGGLPDAGSCGDTLHVTIYDPLGVRDWELGLVDHRTGGWTGEDCLSGDGLITLCHPIGVNQTLVEVADCQPVSVVLGLSTLMDASTEPYLTYYLADTWGCFAWGADPAYYESLGCEGMTARPGRSR